MLKETFSEYLRDQGKKELQTVMIAQLMKAGLKHHAAMLGNYAANGPGPAENPWNDQPLHCGPQPPEQANVGDIWFDTAELTPHIFFSGHEDAADIDIGWYAMHPVYHWQYHSFILNFDYDIVKAPYTGQGVSPALFSVMRMAKYPETDTVTDVYYYESACYAAWFGKWLIGERIAMLADTFPEAITQGIAPKRMNLWDSIGYRGEDDPMAFNLETARYEDYDELETMQLPEEKKVIYTEWERNLHTGFSSYRPANGSVRAEDGLVYPYLKMENSVPRS